MSPLGYYLAAYGSALLVVGAPIGVKFRGRWRIAVVMRAGPFVACNIAASVLLINAGCASDRVASMLSAFRGLLSARLSCWQSHRA